jgi:uncharacterized protein (DUF427 family)
MAQGIPDRFLHPNPSPGFRDHPEKRIVVEPAGVTVTVSWHGVPVATSKRALVLREGSYPPVHYIPIEDVDPSLLKRSAHSTHCPFKGEASYWNLEIGDHEIDNALWGYETPYDEMLEIAGMVAFYPSKVTIETA